MRGVGTACETATLAAPRRLTYRPRERGEFFVADTGETVTTADVVAFTPQGAFID